MRLLTWSFKLLKSMAVTAARVVGGCLSTWVCWYGGGSLGTDGLGNGPPRAPLQTPVGAKMSHKVQRGKASF